MNAAAAERHSRLRSEGGWFALADRARFSVSGADRVRYLNGQVSNDVRKLVPGEALPACVLSAKGKLDAVVLLWAEPERIVVECDAVLAEPLAIRLERYIVADDVEIAPLPFVGSAHVFGPAAALVPDGRKVFRLGVPGIDVEGPAPAALIEATPDEIARLRIERLAPKWGAELGPDTLPAEAGLDTTAVDFHKGCYIGQEVVSRIRSVGHANRALRAFDLAEGIAPSVGAEFFLSGETARVAATVTSIHLSPALGLCYIRRGTPEGATLTTLDGASHIQLRPPDRSNE